MAVYLSFGELYERIIIQDILHRVLQQAYSKAWSGSVRTFPDKRFVVYAGNGL